MPDVVPNEDGTDIDAGEYDGHVRLERVETGRRDEEGPFEIYVDVFRSSVKLLKDNPHVESESFPNTDEGAEDATEFVRGYGFKDVTILPSNRR